MTTRHLPTLMLTALAVLTLTVGSTTASAVAKPAPAAKKKTSTKATAKKAVAAAPEPAKPVGPATPPANSSPLTDLKLADARLKKVIGKQAPSWSPEADATNAEMKKVVGEFLDFEELGKRALAKHWDGLTPPQRTDFITTLRALVERSYISSVHGQPDYQLDLKKEEKDGNDGKVFGVLNASRKGKKIQMTIEYHVNWKAGRWVVYDLITDDVSLLENYRAEFGKLITKEGFDGLLNRMKKKLDAKGG